MVCENIGLSKFFSTALSRRLHSSCTRLVADWGAAPLTALPMLVLVLVVVRADDVVVVVVVVVVVEVTAEPVPVEADAPAPNPDTDTKLMLGGGCGGWAICDWWCK